MITDEYFDKVGSRKGKSRKKLSAKYKHRKKKQPIAPPKYKTQAELKETLSKKLKETLLKKLKNKPSRIEEVLQEEYESIEVQEKEAIEEWERDYKQSRKYKPEFYMDEDGVMHDSSEYKAVKQYGVRWKPL